MNEKHCARCQKSPLPPDRGLYCLDCLPEEELVQLERELGLENYGEEGIREDPAPGDPILDAGERETE